MPTLNQLTSKKGGRIYHKRKGSRSKALRGAPMKRGTCSRVTVMKPKKPNSAQRKIAKVRLNCGRGKKLSVICYIPGKGHSLREYSDVFVRGGHVPDLPGVQYRLIRGSLDFDWKEEIFRRKARSKYGIVLEDSLKHFDKEKKRKK